MDYWVIFTRSVEESFLCISLLSFIFYFMIFICGFFSLKTATSMNKNKPSALYHFTSKSCLDKIASCRIMISTKYGVVFSTSDKKKNKRGRSCNPFKRNGVIIFSGESLDCFNINFTPSLLRLIFLYKIIETDTKEYITKSYGDLHLSQVEEINSHMLLVKKATINPCNKKIYFIRKIKSFIKKYYNISFTVVFLCALLGALGLATDFILIKLTMFMTCLLYVFVLILLSFISYFLGRMDKMIHL